ncbi:hypothetical protein GCM10008171_33550 [Methylopila jiangsuensis]|uniref:Uncharacterized protein n=1 Tax=Methylopila jiangsuensis TaxID=586230 RepID=A0A9W6N5C0_9HYPH|nr:hypothetical protein GCM10008171_33550 [Methylopila jiangsuensis]
MLLPPRRQKGLHFPAERSVSAEVADGGLGVTSKKLGKACLSAMVRRVVESGERARGAQELLKLGRFDEAMDIAYEIEPLLYEANHLLQSASLLRRVGEDFLKGKSKST